MLNERELLARIYKRFQTQNYPGLILGPGDDAAVAKLKPGRVLVATHDDLAEGTHFEVRWTDFRRLAHKLLRVNLSDLAAMGAVEPVGVLASAGFPAKAPAAWATEFLKGLAEDARRFGVPVLGGNLARSEKLFFSMTALGQARPEHLLKRSGAKPGDLIAGVGPLGKAALGLVELKRGARRGPNVRAFWEPEPQLAAGRLLAEKKLARCLIDNSDGLYQSCRLLAEASGLGFEPEPDVADTSGEDYGLVFAVGPRRWKTLMGHLPRAYRLGRFSSSGRSTPPAGGFDHFGS